MTAMDERSSRTAPPCSAPNAIACLSCRNRHLKCDAQRPICGRCAKCRLQCTYQPSRRGRRSQNNAPPATVQKPLQRRPPLQKGSSHSSHRSSSDPEGSISTTQAMSTPRVFSAGSFNCHDITPDSSIVVGDDFMGFSADIWDSPGVRLGGPLDFLGSCLTVNEEPNNANSGSENDADNLIALYYKHFHPAHPFTIPYKLCTQRRKSLPHCLELAMQFAGSHFTNTPGQHWQQCPASEVTSSVEPRPSLHSVQALLVLAITHHGRNELQDSHGILRKATNLAIKIKLHDFETVSAMSQGDRVFEQSAIRTWWELVNTFAVLSTFDSDHEITLNLPESDLPLPCEEHHYISGHVPATARNQKDFLDRAFLRDDFEYSSFAYKIEACRLLMALHELGNDWWSIDKDRIHTVHNSISNFHLSMPLKKREVVAANDGNVDEVLFAAKMLAAVSTILINRPRSSLAGNNPRLRTVGTGWLSEMSFETSKQHTIQALQAANTLSDAAATRSSPCTVICHSPFYTCVVALASTVHIPAYVQSQDRHIRESIKERLKLTTNALLRISENWPMAKAIEAQVLGAVREVMSCKRPIAVPPEPVQGLKTVSILPLNPPSHGIHDDWVDDLFDGGFAL